MIGFGPAIEVLEPSEGTGNTKEGKMTAIGRIVDMLQLAKTEQRMFPATIFYNEGWLLRLVLDWLSRTAVEKHPLTFVPGARWFLEALLPSQFLAGQRADPLAEGWTHADGVIGHVAIGGGGQADTRLAPELAELPEKSDPPSVPSPRA